MNTHDIELPEHWQAFQYNEGWGSWEQVIPSAANKPGVVKAYTADQVVAAIEADRKRRQLEAEEVCAEAYQVVGSLLSDLGIFETHHAEKILDNLSQAKMVHDDVLPWPSFDRKRRGVSSTHTLVEPVAWIQRSYLNLIRESNVALHNVVVRGSILDGDGDVVPLFTAPQPAEPVDVDHGEARANIGLKAETGSDLGGVVDHGEAEPGGYVHTAPDDCETLHWRGQILSLNELATISAEPVKVPSDEELVDLIRSPSVDYALSFFADNPTQDAALGITRALLARYGNNAGAAHE